MRLLIDVNLSPNLASELSARGVPAVHWSTLGVVTSADSEIVDRAREDGFVIVTRDLDYGEMVALGAGSTPSVITIRVRRILDPQLADRLARIVTEFETALLSGALVTLTEKEARYRLLPVD